MAFRLYGNKTPSWTRTQNQVIGAEGLLTQDDRTFPAFTDLNTKYVDLASGNDSTGTGTSAAPFKTLQKGCTARYNAGVPGAFVYVYIKDATTTTITEFIDLLGAKVYTADGVYHTINKPTNVLFTASAMPVNVTTVNCCVEAYGFFWVGTNYGLYTVSTLGTGATWTARNSAGTGTTTAKNISNIVAHTNGKLYILNSTSKYVQVVADPVNTPGTVALAYDLSAKTSVRDLYEITDYLVAVSYWTDGGGNHYCYSHKMVPAGTWSAGATYSGVNNNANMTYSMDGVESVCKSVDILYYKSTDAAVQVDIYNMAISGISPTLVRIIMDGVTNTRYIITLNRVYRFTFNGTVAPLVTELYKAANVAAWTANACGGFIIDSTLYIGLTAKMIKTSDGGATWTSYTLVGSTPYTGIVGSYGLFVAAGTGGLLKDSNASIQDSIGSVTALMSGFVINGNGSRGVYLIGNTTFEYCRITNCTEGIYRYNIADATNIVTLTNTKIDNSSTGVHITVGTGASTDSTWSRVLIHDCSLYGIYNDVPGAVLLMDHITISRCNYGIYWDSYWSEAGVGSLLENSIIFGNYTADIYLASNNTERISYTIARKYIGTPPVITNQITGNPFFVSTTDFNLKDKAGGAVINSVAIGAADDTKDLGCYDVTRSASYSYGVDFVLSVPPAGINRVHQISGFTSIEDVDGNYTEYANGMRRMWNMGWDDNTVSEGWEYQADYLSYLHTLEDVVYEWGNYSNSAWIPKASGSGTVTGSTISVNYDGEVWAPNKYAGYWIKINSVYHRIASHPTKAISGAVVLTLDTVPTTGAQAYSIDFILVKIDKRSGITFKQIQSTLQPWAAYQLTLREVDSYGV